MTQLKLCSGEHIKGKMKTLKGWNETKCNFNVYVNDGDEIDSKLYYYFMEILPPMDEGGSWFLLGEPIDTDLNGDLLYELFITKNGKYYYSGEVTIQDVNRYEEKGLI